MLIITRKLSEGIVVGDGISIVVNEIADGKVKLAIDAPKDVKILRKELIEAAEMNKESAEAVFSFKDKFKVNVGKNFKKDI